MLAQYPYLSVIIGIGIGYLFWSMVAGAYEGDKIERSFRIALGDYYLHVHHWLWSASVLIALFVIEVYNGVVYGALLGSVVQGLQYRDWYWVYYHKDAYQFVHR